MANGQFTVDVAGALNRGLQFRQEQQLRPLQVEQAEQALQGQQQQFQTGQIQQQALQQQVDRRNDEQKTQSLLNAALNVDALPDEQIAPFLRSHIKNVQAQGGDAAESVKALALAEAGDFETVRSGAANLINIGVRQGDLSPEVAKKAPAAFQQVKGGLVFDPNTGSFAIDQVAKQRFDELATKAQTEGKLEFKDRQSLNKDVTTLLKNTVLINNTAKDLEKLGKIGGGPASIALVFKFMKALDPTSVVREGEFATAEKSAGVPESVRNTYNKLVKGERLGAVQIQQFVDTAKELSDSSATSSKEEVGSMLDTFGDTIPDEFKTGLLGRIPKRFNKVEAKSKVRTIGRFQVEEQ